MKPLLTSLGCNYKKNTTMLLPCRKVKSRTDFFFSEIRVCVHVKPTTCSAQVAACCSLHQLAFKVITSTAQQASVGYLES